MTGRLRRAALVACAALSIMATVVLASHRRAPSVAEAEARIATRYVAQDQVSRLRAASPPLAPVQDPLPGPLPHGVSLDLAVALHATPICVRCGRGAASLTLSSCANLTAGDRIQIGSGAGAEQVALTGLAGPEFPCRAKVMPPLRAAHPLGTPVVAVTPDGEVFLQRLTALVAAPRLATTLASDAVDSSLILVEPGLARPGGWLRLGTGQQARLLRVVAATDHAVTLAEDPGSLPVGTRAAAGTRVAAPAAPAGGACLAVENATIFAEGDGVIVGSSLGAQVGIVACAGASCTACDLPGAPGPDRLVLTRPLRHAATPGAWAAPAVYSALSYNVLGHKGGLKLGL